ncbi:helix-turn-helix transcriptional regulator, partial [Serratia bockelmannii]|uniref:helix-turn-helix transcriptional regulator n=1 Tax=Serratia bockelmannii TaxID=2703793 RepID=UPI003CFA597B
MNTLADRYYRDTHYPIPHADFLRLQHAHATGVLFLDLLDTLDQVLYTTGLSRSTVYEMMSRKQFPVQVSLGGKNVAWLASEVELWMDERIANRHQEAAA